MQACLEVEVHVVLPGTISIPEAKALIHHELAEKDFPSLQTRNLRTSR